MSDTQNTTVNVKEILAAAQAKIEALQKELEPLVEQLKPVAAAANVAHGYGLTEDMSADEIISFFERKVNLQTPEVALVPSVLSSGAPVEIERASQQVIQTYRTLGNLAGQLAGVVLSLR